MARVAIGGFQHETNTFSTQPATLDDFLLGGGWPGLLKGDEIATVAGGMNLPIAGAMRMLHELGHTAVPLVWAAATPSGAVLQEAFEHIWSAFSAALDAAGAIDALYLDLHGAMVTTAHLDAEGEFLRRLRAKLSERPIVVASLDLHANVSREMFELTDGLASYRSYPHVDMDETGSRAAVLLDTLLRRSTPIAKAFRQVDFKVALPNQCTLVEPGRTLYRELVEQARQPGLISLDWAGGFALADVPDAQQSVFVYAEHAARAEAAVDRFAKRLHACRDRFQHTFRQDRDAVAYAISRAGLPGGPTVLADIQDNPGGGGTSDTTGILRCLVEQRADNALLAIMHDPQAARLAHEAGVGARLTIELGGRSTTGEDAPGMPLRAKFEVLFLSDGRFTGTGPMWGGSPIDLGPTALLRADGVRVIVSSRKMQAADQSIIRHVGIDPASLDILVLKSSVHFRADFDALAREVLLVESPGRVYARLDALHFVHAAR
ncbi:M81 family metallopeptidase [Paraburkholderia tropica]|uniref:M81 family metallopeptidase n=1 Tax=Paraburkholderia tropica TaxID=92647 RepID=UPI002AB7EE59|nr:M81 family metallopeptidase [Paraburkholderia tropica]